MPNSSLSSTNGTAAACFNRGKRKQGIRVEFLIPMESYSGYSIPEEGDTPVPPFQTQAQEKISEKSIPPKFL
jgi:hypothetical protein